MPDAGDQVIAHRDHERCIQHLENSMRKYMLGLRVSAPTAGHRHQPIDEEEQTDGEPRARESIENGSDQGVPAHPVHRQVG